MTSLTAMTPVYTAELFEPLHAALLELLRGLSSDDCERPCVGRWTVRDVVAHLLDGDFRKLSLARDRHSLTLARPVRSYEDLVALINDLNASGVAHGQRFSTRMMTD